jgi:hypothetical protein
VTVNAVALDVGWLITLDDESFTRQCEAYNFIDRLIKSDAGLLIDSEGKIVAEYAKYMKEMRVGRNMLTELFKASRVYVSGRPSAACLRALKGDSFDPSDIPYIGVAQNGSGVYITHEEKHLVAARCAIVEAECSVRIVGAQHISSLLAS